ncbi:hypothetical protein JTB14_038338 [Gonioctena quinquepunctata]|nr:hypothetical protein JTB14_038338 [Gonioctena quinquepunctata]
MLLLPLQPYMSMQQSLKHFPRRTKPYFSTQLMTRNYLISNDPPVATNIQTEQTPESPQPGQKRGPTESVDDSDSPEPHFSKPPNDEIPLMPPPA